MPDLEVTVAGRGFQVSCQPGEEHFLRSAAAILDAEAAPLLAQMGRLPDAKLLLMAGLMLADKTAAIEDEMRGLRARPAATREVAVIPPEVFETLAEIAARAEAMAAKVEEQA